MLWGYCLMLLLYEMVNITVITKDEYGSATNFPVNLFYIILFIIIV